MVMLFSFGSNGMPVFAFQIAVYLLGLALIGITCSCAFGEGTVEGGRRN